MGKCSHFLTLSALCSETSFRVVFFLLKVTVERSLHELIMTLAWFITLPRSTPATPQFLICLGGLLLVDQLSMMSM